MKEKLKQIFTLNTILIAYICAIGYGIGYALPEYFGYRPLICFVISMVFGSIFYYIGMKVLNSKYFNESKKRKIIFTAIFYACYFIISLTSLNFLDHDIDNDFFINLIFIIGFQILAFIVQYIFGLLELKKKK